jgi:hypothetical protein
MVELVMELAGGLEVPQWTLVVRVEPVVVVEVKVMLKELVVASIVDAESTVGDVEYG